MQRAQSDPLHAAQGGGGPGRGPKRKLFKMHNFAQNLGEVNLIKICFAIVLLMVVVDWSSSTISLVYFISTTLDVAVVTTIRLNSTFRGFPHRQEYL